MLDTEVQSIIAAIHNSAHMLVLEFAGAGSQALFWLHAVPGSSRTILEATDRYGATSMADLLGHAPAHAVADETAIVMASAAYQRARRLAPAGMACLGVGCTAALVTDRARRGEDRCSIAVRDQAGFATYSLVMTKALRDRLGEEELVARLLIAAIAQACGTGTELPLGLHGDEQVVRGYEPAADLIAQLLAGQARTVSVAPDGARQADAPIQCAILSGSFNPLHAGHERLAQAAGEALGMPVTFELPVLNADKAPLDYAEIERRLAQFRWRFPVVLSREALFVEKTSLYPGCVFVIGYDTAERLVEPRYYGGEAQRDAALAQIRAHGCRFLVAGRVEGGAFHTLREIAVPAAASDLFSELMAHVLRPSGAVQCFDLT